MTTKEEQQEIKERVLNWFADDLKQGKNPKLYTVLRSVSRSKMSRKIDVYYFKATKEGTVAKYYLNGIIEQVTSFTRDKQTYALKVGGCGMDMGFHLIYTFSRCLFRDVDISQYKINGRNGEKYETTDAGYILNQEWL